MNMSQYNKEQFDTLAMVSAHLTALSAVQRRKLAGRLDDYLAFRREVDEFLRYHFSEVCTANCFQSRRSACCSKEGIITFFADVVVNALNSTADETEALFQALQFPRNDFKCVYLGPSGCLWRVRPIVCAMFLCDAAAKNTFDAHPPVVRQWERFRERRQRFTWPDRAVLFDELEKFFIAAGCTSPLMYLHNSPGLLRVKRLNRL
jgi:hypothetical protein